MIEIRLRPAVISLDPELLYVNPVPQLHLQLQVTLIPLQTQVTPISTTGNLVSIIRQSRSRSWTSGMVPQIHKLQLRMHEWYFRFTRCPRLGKPGRDGMIGIFALL